MSDIRRTIDELVARYELEPDLRDIYVEGDIDKSVMEWFLSNHKSLPMDVAVYEISTVDIPAYYPSKFEVYNNNRGRTIVLAHLLEERLGKDSHQVTCVVDKDFDGILMPKYDCSFLLFTDYACIEMYAFNESTIEKFLQIYAGRTPDSITLFLDQLTLALGELFLIRLANEVLQWNMSATSWHKCCTIGHFQIEFDRDEFLKRYLNSNSRSHNLQQFQETVERFRLSLSSDVRQHIHGHDFAEMLRLCIKYFKKISMDTNELRRVILLSIEAHELSKEGLFMKLLNRLST